ncbi:MAG: HD domain-containing protein [Candidatus Saccharimonadales bacterium]
MSRPDINRVIDFQRLMLQFSHIERITHRVHKDAFVQENDTEHSYNLALTAWFLVQYFPKLDRNLIIRLALVHDLVEIHAGDTYVYADAATLASKHSREAAALRKLQSEWADFPEMLHDIEAYEMRASEEAKFVYALDKIMPMMLIYISDGYTWQKEGITLKQLHSIKQDKVSVSPEITPYYNQLYDILTKSPHLLPLK